MFETAAERDIMRGQICKTINGDYMPSGLTPPTADIVKRRFELTRKNDSYLPYRIRSVIDEIGHFGNGTGRLVNPVTGEPVQDVQTTTAVEVMSETVVEEVNKCHLPVFILCLSNMLSDYAACVSVTFVHLFQYVLIRT